MPADLQTVVQRMVEAGEPEDNIRLIIEHYGQAPPRGTPPPASATIGMLQPSTARGDPAPQPIHAPAQGRATRLIDLVDTGESGRDAERYQDSLGFMIPTPPVRAAVAGAKSVPGILARAGGISKVRAGTNIAEAVTAAKDVPLNTQAIQTAVDEMMQFAQPGEKIENVPRVVQALAKRLAKGGDFTVQKARLYAPAISRGSANEWGSLTPNMQRLLGGLRAPLNEAITDAAATVGKGEQYAAGMKEYARASRAGKFAEKTLKPAAVSALKWLLRGSALAGGYETYDKLFND